MVLDASMYVLHTLFAALWAGSVLFVAIGVFPAAKTRQLGVSALQLMLNRLLWITRASVLIALITGGHLAAALYTADSLTGSSSGYLVLTMLLLWLVLAGLVELGCARARTGNSIQEINTAASPMFTAGAIFAIGLLLVAGLLGAHRLFGIF